MSRAFVKESDGAEGEELPELLISPHRNLVTPDGMRLIDATSFWEPMRKSLGDKRRVIPPERSQDILRMLAEVTGGPA